MKAFFIVPLQNFQYILNLCFQSLSYTVSLAANEISLRREDREPLARKIRV